jgi:hypothetical protein
MEDIADAQPMCAVSENSLTQQELSPFPAIFLKSEIKVSSFLLYSAISESLFSEV